MINGFLPVSIGASNDDFSGSTEANIFPDEFKYFAQRLVTYPRETGDQVFFSSGGDDEAWSSYVYLGIQTLESNQKLVLQIRLRRNEPEIKSGGTAFFIAVQKEDLNRLGQALVDWLGSPDETLVFPFSEPA